ncbi:MAG: hypothetical protein ACO3G9_11280, partial [Chthoniobacterales bacterium]
ETRIESIQLVDGRRVFRVSDALTGLCLERTADPSKPIRQQTEKLTEALQALRSMPICTAA